jgi:hypothetical protein
MRSNSKFPGFECSPTTTEREISFSDSHAIHYRPKDKADPTKNIRLSGKVAQVKTAYAFIEVPGFLDSFVPVQNRRT